MTARLKPSSMVKRSRDQSSEAPSFLSWPVMTPAYLSFQSQAMRRNSSRPIFSRDRPFSASRFSMTLWTAIEAWSVPGSHMQLKPCILFQRVMMSGRVKHRAWPMWRMPVTFAGGRTIENLGFEDLGSPTKSPSSSQNCPHFSSTGLGS